MNDLEARSATLQADGLGSADSRQAAFARFVELRLADHYRLATVILGDPAEAQDATHDAFERAWHSWPALRDPERVDAWMGRILVNTCRDRLRRRRRRPVLDISDELSATLSGPDELAVAVDRDEIGRAFGVLNADQQVALALRYYTDLTVDQIAARTGAPSGTVKSRLHHALTALSAELRRNDARGSSR